MESTPHPARFTQGLIHRQNRLLEPPIGAPMNSTTSPGRASVSSDSGAITRLQVPVTVEDVEAEPMVLRCESRHDAPGLQENRVVEIVQMQPQRLVIHADDPPGRQAVPQVNERGHKAATAVMMSAPSADRPRGARGR